MHNRTWVILGFNEKEKNQLLELSPEVIWNENPIKANSFGGL